MNHKIFAYNLLYFVTTTLCHLQGLYFVWCTWTLFTPSIQFFVQALSGLVFGILLTDILTVIVHFMFDNFFAVDSWVVGSTVKYFRQHHDKPQKMVKRSYYRGNWKNAFAGLLVGSIIYYYNYHSIFLNSCASIMVLSLSLINQFHKWMHIDKSRGRLAVPWPCRILMNAGLICSGKYHDIHHKNLVSHYSMLCGWSENIFHAIYLYHMVDGLYYLCTGSMTFDSRIEIKNNLKEFPTLSERLEQLTQINFIR